MTCLDQSEPGCVLQQNHTSRWVFELWAQRQTGSSESRGPSVLRKRLTLGGRLRTPGTGSLPWLCRRWCHHRVYRVPRRVRPRGLYLSAVTFPQQGVLTASFYPEDPAALRASDSLTSRSLARAEQVQEQLSGLRAVYPHCPSLRLPGENCPKSLFCNSDNLFGKVALCLILSL